MAGVAGGWACLPLVHVAMPFSQLVDYGRIVLWLLLTFAQVTGLDHLAAFVQDQSHFDFVV